MQSSFALSGTLQVLKQEGLLVDPAAIDGETLEDQLSAPLVTADGGTYGGVPSVKERRRVVMG